MQLPPRWETRSKYAFRAEGVRGALYSAGSLTVEHTATVNGSMSLAVDQNRVALRHGRWPNGTRYAAIMRAPPNVTLHGAARLARSLMVEKDVYSWTWCPSAPLRPNTTNLTLHVLAGFSNNTNDSYPMAPCNHSVSVGRTLHAQGGLQINVSRYRYDFYGKPLFTVEPPPPPPRHDPNASVRSPPASYLDYA